MRAADPRPPGDERRSLSPQEQDLLRQRAARYAQQTGGEGDRLVEVVVFSRGAGRYAVSLTHLREIRPLRRLCMIPGASRTVPGIFYTRGEVLSAHDLAGYMGGAAASPTAPWVMIAEKSSERIGLMADEVIGVEAIRVKDIRSLPVTFGAQIASLEGVFGDGVMLLNVPALFTTAAFFRAF